jgi:hypothetical protein
MICKQRAEKIRIRTARDGISADLLRVVGEVRPTNGKDSNKEKNGERKECGEELL